MDNTKYTLESLADINFYEGLAKEQIASFEKKENAFMVQVKIMDKFNINNRPA